MLLITEIIMLTKLVVGTCSKQDIQFGPKLLTAFLLCAFICEEAQVMSEGLVCL